MKLSDMIGDVRRRDLPVCMFTWSSKAIELTPTQGDPCFHESGNQKVVRATKKVEQAGKCVHLCGGSYSFVDGMR